MPDLSVTLTGPYQECAECQHPGPGQPFTAVTIAERPGEASFYLTPHRAGCSLPRPFSGDRPVAHIKCNGGTDR